MTNLPDKRDPKAPKPEDEVVDYEPIADGATQGSPSGDGEPARGEAGRGPGMKGEPQAAPNDRRDASSDKG